MGTNYYVKTNDCKCCGRNDEKHIGKSSGGWAFALHVYPEDGINNLDDWLKILSANPNSIKDEYEKSISLEELVSIITERKWEGFPFRLVPFGYFSWRDFHEKNNSEEGPNGLLRHRLGNDCVSHGSGTWDCIVGEFS